MALRSRRRFGGSGDLAQLTAAELADRWGDLEARSAQIERETKALREEFQRRELAVAIGSRWAVLESTSQIGRLDIPLIRAEMGAAWCKAHETTSVRTSYCFSAVLEDGKAA